MNTVLWIVQLLLGLVFIMVGVLKVAVPREKMLASVTQTGRQNMGWVKDFSASHVRLIGLLELLGGIGLILPALTGILPALTPLAAIGLAVLMLGAIVVHLRRHEPSLVVGPLTLALAAAFIAFGRFVFVPL
ncbi:MAG: DoxX family protein [Pleurocapsa minor GSE-CHR-MK-17-07R]|nr:DoxX family protein [Pleurocapsa minor GSE-CHR-MK 17-07R]